MTSEAKARSVAAVSGSRPRTAKSVVLVSMNFSPGRLRVGQLGWIVIGEALINAGLSSTALLSWSIQSLAP
jgi:hypothetical protein